MPTGKPTDLSWVQQLDELMPPAGSSFDKAAAWEKLHEKLEGNQQPKKTIWLWWAAASVILLTGIFWVLGNNVTPKTTTVIVKKSNNAVPAPTTEKILPVTVKKNIQPQFKYEKTFPVTEKKKSTDVNQPALSNQFQAINNKPVNIIDTNSVKKTNAIAVQPDINKKKLAVVHNNELAREDINETPPATSNSNTGIIPDFRKNVFENTIKAENMNEPSVKYKKRFLPFGNSYKPKD